MSAAGQTHPRRRISVALTGNPNVGKSTLFNLLTGGRQHVANYAGVTVEMKEGTFIHDGVEVTLVDLPGMYSLTAHRADEQVAVDFLLDRPPDVVVDVVDASNLERNLFLAVQFLELELPLVLAFNMWDTVEASGQSVDTGQLARMFGCPIVCTAAARNRGIEELKSAMVRAATTMERRTPTRIPYGPELDAEVEAIAGHLSQCTGALSRLPPRWVAVKLLESDASIRARLTAADPAHAAILQAVAAAEQRVHAVCGDPPDMIVADRRYGFISGACREALLMTVEARHDASDRIDEVLTHRVLGVPIFLGMMYLVFKLSFTLGEYPTALLESLFGWIGTAVTRLWPAAWPELLRSLLVDGALAGMGGVLVFVPTILLLFLAIAVLEDSGYMARAAFIMDSIMHRFGLHGKSFIPMLIGFGCTVPAIMATRMLESRRDRLSTMLVLPLFSCGARIPIYTLFIGAFFEPRWRTPVMMMLYLIGVVLAVLLARLLRSTLFRGEPDALVMDLPPYRVPTLRGLALHTTERAWHFVRKAGTTVLAISVILWAMSVFPRAPVEALNAAADSGSRAQVQLEWSAAGRVGRAMEHVMRHAGFDAKASTALIGALAAKEVFVSQLGIVNSLGDQGASSTPLREALQRTYTPLQAFCIMLFCLISMPCIMTLVTTWKESGSWHWAAVQLGGLTILAYTITVAVYQTGLWITG
jgi:ferrous iron transport protein B